MQGLLGMISIEICYHVTKKTDIEAMDLLLETHMRKFKGDWVASDYRWSDRKHWWFWSSRERSNTYIIAAEDLEDVKVFLDGCFYVHSVEHWPFMNV
jgi:hypothetical protein